ncbi:MAG: hypothetical protein QMC78_04655 [Methanocellales archaeon]|nr:hypothetical protein [Methanocellales archaeon]
MDNKHHVRRQNRFMPKVIDNLFTESNSEIARKVNEDKDSMSPKVPGINHRTHGHGVGSNIKYLQKYRLRGWKAGIQHDLDDVRDTLGRYIGKR